MERTSSLLGKFLLLITAAVWGSTFFIIRDSVDVISPAVLLSYRFLIAAVILGIIVLLQKKKLWQDWQQGLVLGVLMAISLLAQSWGLQYTSAANSGFITGLMIVFIPIYNRLFWRQKSSLQQLGLIGLALCGLYILVGGITNANFGDIITLITAIAYGFYVVYVQHLMQKSDPIVANFQQCVVVASISFVVAISTQSTLVIPAVTVWTSILYLSIFATCVAFSFQLIGQKYVSTLPAALLLSTEPLFAAFFAWLLGGESISMNQFIGGLCIFTAIIGNEYFGRKGND